MYVTTECERNELQQKVRLLHMEEEACSRLQQRVQQLEEETSDTQLQLNKANAKYHSACRQQEVRRQTSGALLFSQPGTMTLHL